MNAKDMFFSSERQETRAELKQYNREDFIYNVTEDLMVILEELDVTKAELAKKLGKSKAYISQLLSGSRNMTLGTLADICFELDTSPSISFSGHSLQNDEFKEFEVYWHNEYTNSKCANEPISFQIESKKNVLNLEQTDNWLEKTA